MAWKWRKDVNNDKAPTARVWDIAFAIMQYLETCPEAKDTLEGIAQCWLWLELTEPFVGKVNQALTLLVSQGLIL